MIDATKLAFGPEFDIVAPIENDRSVDLLERVVIVSEQFDIMDGNGEDTSLCWSNRRNGIDIRRIDTSDSSNDHLCRTENLA